MTFDPLYIAYGAIAVVLILLIWVIRLEVKIHKLLKGSDGKSLESAIVSGHKNIEKLNDFQRQAIEHLLNIEKRLKRSVQAVQTLRFNPFKGNGEGGNQSFSTSFINENGDGVVISSLYSRDRVSVFSKPVQKFESDFELTEEEQEVIKNSKANLR